MIAPDLFAAIVSAGILMVPAANGQHPLAAAALAGVVVIGWVALIRVVGRGVGEGRHRVRRDDNGDS